MTDDPAVWMALGAAVANRECMARLLALCPARDWPDARVRRLTAALAQGRAATAEALGALGIPLAEGQKAVEAVLDVAAGVEKRRQVEMAGRLAAAAKLLNAADFRAFLEKETRVLSGIAAVEVAG